MYDGLTNADTAVPYGRLTPAISLSRHQCRSAPLRRHRTLAGPSYDRLSLTKLIYRKLSDGKYERNKDVVRKKEKILSWMRTPKISPVRDWRSTPLEWLSNIRDLDLDLGSGHAAHRRASVIELYLHLKFHWNRKKNFCGRIIRRDPSKFKVTWHKN